MPKGYISKKTIGGKQYLYLQTSNGDTVESKYIKAEELEEITSQLSLRKEYEAELPEVILRLADIETAAELLDKALLRKLKMLKTVHIHDNDVISDQHLLPYAGKLNRNEITSALKAIKYNGEFTFEVTGF